MNKIYKKFKSYNDQLKIQTRILRTTITQNKNLIQNYTFINKKKMYEIYSIIIKRKIFCDNEKISINFYSEILSGIPIQIFGC